MSEHVAGGDADAPHPAVVAANGWREPRRKGWPAPLVGLVVALALAVLGAPLGWLWSVLAPGVPLVKTEGGARLTDPQPEEFVAADGWFTLLGLGFGLLAAIVVWAAVRRHRGPFVLLGVAVGTVGAALVAWWLGDLLVQGDFDELLASAPPGTPLSRPPELRAGGFEWLWGVIPTLRGDVLLPAFSAVVAYTLLAGWSRYPSLAPEPDPVFPWPCRPPRARTRRRPRRPLASSGRPGPPTGGPRLAPAAPQRHGHRRRRPGEGPAPRRRPVGVATPRPRTRLSPQPRTGPDMPRSAPVADRMLPRAPLRPAARQGGPRPPTSTARPAVRSRRGPADWGPRQRREQRGPYIAIPAATPPRQPPAREVGSP
ncbi:hypothetical protein Psuf_057010 [Phytohabitans suffuscus]|uniref:DUF2567 domain-containing protein n=1 Tax=Phytohabitans suffuscus TaxID=624315 RepID=A0A6F8YR43_9ACTN|nr:DUF2567 domain-containing protein [Phytohabitans suffuscus]BCB88388.1 hypothetical protein Psuf_057010 [Phytohabitans suffuscus]